MDEKMEKAWIAAASACVEVIDGEHQYVAPVSPEQWERALNAAFDAARLREPAGVDYNYRAIAHLIGSIFFSGDFKAETANERTLESLLKEVGTRYTSLAEVEAGYEALSTPQPPAEAQAQGGGEVVAWYVVDECGGLIANYADEASAREVASRWENRGSRVRPLVYGDTAPPSAPVGVEGLDTAVWNEVLELPDGFRVAEHLPGIWEYQFDIEDEADEDSDRKVSGTSWNHPALAAIAAWIHAYDALAQQPAAMTESARGGEVAIRVLAAIGHEPCISDRCTAYVVPAPPENRPPGPQNPPVWCHLKAGHDGPHRCNFGGGYPSIAFRESDPVGFRDPVSICAKCRVRWPCPDAEKVFAQQPAAQAAQPDECTGVVVSSDFLAGVNEALRAIAAIPESEIDAETNGHEDAYRAVEALISQPGSDNGCIAAQQGGGRHG